MLSQGLVRSSVTAESGLDGPSGLVSNPDNYLTNGVQTKNATRRPSTSGSGQQPPQQSSGITKQPQQAENLNRPSSTGVPSAQLRGSISLQAEPPLQSYDELQSARGQHAASPIRDSALRASKDGRPVSRPNATAAQSPYLQPPSGRAAQVQSHRPNSRQPTQASPQPQHPQHPQTPASVTTALAGTACRGSSSGSGGPSFINGARIIQTYCAPVGKPSQPAAVAAGALHMHAKLPSQSVGRPPAEQQQPHVHPHQQQRPTAAQQQQQQAGPRATTALTGARVSQRGRQESGTGAAPGAEQLQQVAGRGGAMAGHSYHAGPYGGNAPLTGAAGLIARESDGNSASFGYDDIPEEVDESSSPLVSNAYSGLTLDQYMQRMVTTPASAAATSGLGVSADSEESAPCSPGNASTRTEEDDMPCISPCRGGPSTLGLGVRGTDADRDRQIRASRGAGQPPHPGMPRLSTSTPSTRAAVSAAGSGSRYGGEVGAARAGGGPTSGSLYPGGGAGGVRSSGTNQGFGRGATGTGAAPGRGGEDAPGGGGGGGGGIDVSSLMMDDDSSDDEQHNPSALINSPRTARHLSSRASAMAFSNSLDLRPATAAVVSSPSMTRGDASTVLGMAMSLGADSGNHHAIIKQVDLGGLSASLFMPNNSNSGREGSSPASSALPSATADMHVGSNPSSPDMAAVGGGRGAGGRGSGASTMAAGPSMLRGSVSSNSESPALPGGGGGAVGTPKALASPKTTAIPPPWGVSAREGAFGGVAGGDGGGVNGGLQALASRPLSSRVRPPAMVPGSGSADAAVASPSGAGPAAATAGAGRPGSSAKWAKPQHTKPADGGPVELPPEARLLAAEAQSMARPPTRQVQSARPPGARGEVELDPSVWQANIAMQLQRPPSRQKPPPEALHLWTPEQQMSMLASGGLGRNVGGGRPLGVRPQSAAPTTYRTRPASGPSVKAHGPVGDDVAGSVARPPSRQKPPPLSTLLEHDDFPPPPPAGSRRPRPGADQLDVVVSGSDDDSSDDDMSYP